MARSQSRDRVVEVLRDGGAMSRSDIARHASLSRATVSTVVTELQEAGLLGGHDAAGGGGLRGEGGAGGAPPGGAPADPRAAGLLGGGGAGDRLRQAPP